MNVHEILAVRDEFKVIQLAITKYQLTNDMDNLYTALFTIKNNIRSLEGRLRVIGEGD